MNDSRILKIKAMVSVVMVFLTLVLFKVVVFYNIVIVNKYITASILAVIGIVSLNFSRIYLQELYFNNKK